MVRPAVDTLGLTIDGRPAAASTTRRRRSVFYNVLQYAVELELLDFNPVDKLRVRSSRRKVAREVDRRVVVNIRQARELLTGVTYVGQRGKNGRRGERLVAFYPCLYFAALRPSEALGLRERDCLRHAGVSLWLNAGLPAPEVAQRTGHSVDVLLKVYAKCLDGDRSRMNERIEAALSQ
ncbi:hypothetical protein OG777_08360 [Micromonospora peucetia]|uniref:hypothetical protein n=1 Tax=Micromonospora peucetia TaxID=47871 RepID=UPI002251B679|nr:hypothetical protein [Micromonospora peucetia]MCX4386939.1 hypothetical protein [Micromonospora peucetia]